MFAGPFGEWLAAARASLRDEGRGMHVACGECRGCCTSSMFVHVRPDDAPALSVIPKRLLVRAPGQPRGHLLLGFTDDGSCPMLKHRECSIYEQRPRTCRDYDCRIFAAAGIDAGEGKDEINERVRAWEFSYQSDAERRDHDAIRAAAAFLRDRRHSFPGGAAPSAPEQIAVIALKVYPVFLKTPAGTDADIATAITDASRAFDRQA
jgi:Fe-S-cluster containining protein